MNKPSCESCRYFGGVLVRNGQRVGACRKHTPRVDKDGAAAWPLVKPGDWCGEHMPSPMTPPGPEAVER